MVLDRCRIRCHKCHKCHKFKISLASDWPQRLDPCPRERESHQGLKRNIQQTIALISPELCFHENLWPMLVISVKFHHVAQTSTLTSSEMEPYIEICYYAYSGGRGGSQPKSSRFFVTAGGRTAASFADRLLAHTQQAVAHTPKKQKNMFRLRLQPIITNPMHYRNFWNAHWAKEHAGEWSVANPEWKWVLPSDSKALPRKGLPREWQDSLPECKLPTGGHNMR